MPAAEAVRRRLAWYGQQLSTRPSRYIPCGRVSGRRASALPRRVSAAKRSRNVAWSRALDAVLITPFPCARRLRVSTRVGVPSTLRRSMSTTRRGTSRFTTCALESWRQGRRRGRPGAPVRTGSRPVSRRARTSADKPSGHSQSGAGAAPRRTRSRRRRISGISRGARTSPASHRRVLTIIASALHTRPPGVLTRISSACTWPRSRGRSTRGAWTAWPCRPARAPHAATVRSSNPQATTIACSGQPCARRVTTRVTVSAEVRRR